MDAHAARQARADERYKWVALANTTASVFMSMLDGSIVIIAMPAIFRGIHAGWVIALACDFCVARDDVPIGDIRSEKAIFANQGVGLMLPHLIGASRAMDLPVTGRVIDAAEAERFGILQRLWPAADWDRELAAFTGELAAGPTRVYAAWKASVNRSVLLDLDAYTDHENLLNVALIGSADHDEGIASFREKRRPVLTGR